MKDQQDLGAPASEDTPDPSKPEWYWNIWKFLSGRSEGGCWAYIIHMEFEGSPGKTLCGLGTRNSIWDAGGLNLIETIPGCIRCQNALRKRGLGAWIDRSGMDIKQGKHPVCALAAKSGFIPQQP